MDGYEASLDFMGAQNRLAAFVVDDVVGVDSHFWSVTTRP